MMSNYPPRWFGGTLLLVVLSSGCVLPNYRYGRFKDSSAASAVAATNLVTVDKPHLRLDRIERTIFRPIEGLANLAGMGEVQLGSRDQRMQQSLDTTMQYFGDNELSDVFVDVRRYDPPAQWARLRANKNIHPVWKYTAGSVVWATESVLPPRVFRYSYYNPYTNTLALNSVWREWNISEAARAKDYLGAKFPGTYAVAQHIPFVPIYQEVRIGTDALSYARASGDQELERELYPYAYGEVFGHAITEAAIVVPGLSGLPHVAAPIIWGTSFVGGYGVGTLKKYRHKSNNSGDLACDRLNFADAVQYLNNQGW